jgi:hypothetical protein
MGNAKIGVDDEPVPFHLAGRALGDLAAVVEHEDPVGEVHHHAHAVLDQGNRRAELPCSHRGWSGTYPLLEVHAGHRLINGRMAILRLRSAA